MWVNNLPKVATQWNSDATLESNPGPRVQIPSALTTKPLSHAVLEPVHLKQCVSVASKTRNSVCSSRMSTEYQTLHRLTIIHHHTYYERALPCVLSVTSDCLWRQRSTDKAMKPKSFGHGGQTWRLWGQTLRFVHNNCLSMFKISLITVTY